MTSKVQNSRRRTAAAAKAFLILLTALVSSFLTAYAVRQARPAPALITVPDDQPTIQEAINIAKHGDSILVNGGIYSEHVVVNKSVRLVGEAASTATVDGGGSGVIILVTASNVTVEGLRVRNGHSGIVVARAQNCTVSWNLVEGSRDRGILITLSRNCTVRGNHAVLSSSGYGINVNASQNVLVEDNGASSNYYDGIGVLSSSNVVVRGNTVNNNTLMGLWVDSSQNNLFHHNNAFANGANVRSNAPLNSWDNGLEGNYWSNYTGVDADGDGVGDEAFVVDQPTWQQDRFPLIRPVLNEVYRSIDTDAPAASFTHAPERPLVNETVSFDASESYDVVGENAIIEYRWDFGDGATAAGIQVDHTYAVPGNQTVVLAVVDVAGNTGYATVEVSVVLKNSGDGGLLAAAVAGVLLIGGGVGLVALLWKRRRRPRQ
jgi:parallel beta-helix repeat protein